MTPEMARLLGLVARRPCLPQRYMALLLGMDAGEVELRLLIAESHGLVRVVQERCCGVGALYEVSEAGLEAGVAGQIHGA